MEKKKFCPDCGNISVLTSQGICNTCKVRKQNAKARKKTYIPYIKLSKEEKEKIDRKRLSHSKQLLNEVIVPKAKSFDPLSDEISFIKILRDCGCEIPENTLKEVLKVLATTNQLRNIIMTITETNGQQAMLDLEQALNVCERKLQHDWEYNNFQEADDIKFKGFLVWRRILKGGIFFWKKLYQTNTIIEIQRAWNAYTQDPNEKILMANDKIESTKKRYQITTESISNIYNTKRPFTRIFYADSKNEAYDLFVNWMAERNFKENKKKTVITEL